MMGGELDRYLPPEWAEAYEPLALLKDGAQRQTLLLRERTPEPGRLAVMKRDAGGAEHLQNEFELLAALKGYGVPAAYAFLNRKEASYLIREYVQGETLLDYMQKRPKLSAREASEIGIEICRVLRRLHEQQPPVVHRDVKAENIIRRSDGSCALIDFGIARRQRGDAQRDTELLGTPSVAPPEQFGLRQTSPSADVYAVGVLLRELSTGELGLDRGKPPAALRGIIRRCTAVNPARRYRNAAELERALHSAAKRKPLPWIVCAGLVLAALLAWVALPNRAMPSELPAALPSGGPQAASLDASEPPSNEQQALSPDASEPYAFASPAIEAEVCRQLGREPGSVTRADLASIQRLLLVGETPFERWDALRVFGEDVQLNGQSVYSFGSIDTLADIPNFPNLSALALCNQQIRDLSPLEGSAVRQLALCGNEITDLAPLAGCRQIQELFISNNPIEDLSPISACESLWKINLGATRVSNLDGLDALPRLRYVEIHDCWNLTDISALAEVEALWHLSLRPVLPDFVEVIGRLTQLENLYLWYTAGKPDLTKLSALTELKRLFVDGPRIASLRGVEAMQQLNYLEIYSDTPLDLSPLSGLEHLAELLVANLRAEDWTPLASLPNLKRVYCTPVQAEEIRGQLGPDELRAELIPVD